MSSGSRTENSLKNISYGIIATIINTLVSFVSRTVLVKTLGTEVLGLNGLFTEVITVISLAELGVGMAIIYSLYKPISENNYRKINQLMTLYRTAYNTIAIVTLAIGICVIPWVHVLITDVEFSLSYIRLIFFLFVVKTSSSYIFAYKTSLLNADQKQYVVSVITAIVKLVTTIIIVLFLLLFRNYVTYLMLLIVQGIITNTILSKIVDNRYQYLDYKEKLDISERREIFANIKNIFIKRVSSVFTSSTDNILISVLVSTRQVGLYSNYSMIFSVIRTIRQQLINGLAASIGNLNVTAETEHCIEVLRRLTYVFFVFAMIMSSGSVAVLKPFIKIWIGDAFIMPDMIINIAILNLFIEICCDPLWQFLEVSGLFRKDKNIAIVGSTINLIVSIVLGKKIGISGIFLGTVCTQVTQLVLKTILIFGEKFKTSSVSYLSMWVRISVSYFVMLLLQHIIFKHCIISNLYIEFLVKGIISVIIAIVCSIPLFIKSDELDYLLNLLRKAIYREVGKKHE
ncbi:lipopolysaccharide biosynthesis protein [Oribacterium sp. HCP3S3_B9]|uniref:lipopolysaccharide biosynthesis protein n=1 Tax=Oribacterium sp. HCP3S3_B9 TaxID=3438946 RepID=UPI003F8C443A